MIIDDNYFVIYNKKTISFFAGMYNNKASWTNVFDKAKYIYNLRTAKRYLNIIKEKNACLLKISMREVTL